MYFGVRTAIRLCLSRQSQKHGRKASCGARTVKKLESTSIQRFAGDQEIAPRPLARLSLVDELEMKAGTISGSVDQELLLRSAYLVRENRIFKNQIKGRLQLTDPERINVAEMGQRLGKKALEEVARLFDPKPLFGTRGQSSDGGKSLEATRSIAETRSGKENPLAGVRSHPNRSSGSGVLLLGGGVLFFGMQYPTALSTAVRAT